MIVCKAKKLYGEKLALDVDYSFEEGKIYAIIGNNGSGKSTLLNVLAKQIRFEGEITLPGNVVYMTQAAYNFDFSVKQNVLLFVPKKDAQKRQDAERMMKEIGLDGLAKKNANKLSGGEGQKTALLRTLMQDAKVLLLDEPTSSMDVTSTKIAEKLLLEYQKKTGCTVFIVTHSVAQAETLADEIFFFDSGKLIEHGKDIVQNPESEQLKTYLQTR